MKSFIFFKFLCIGRKFFVCFFLICYQFGAFVFLTIHSFFIFFFLLFKFLNRNGHEREITNNHLFNLFKLTCVTSNPSSNLLAKWWNFSIIQIFGWQSNVKLKKSPMKSFLSFNLTFVYGWRFLTRSLSFVVIYIFYLLIPM